MRARAIVAGLSALVLAACVAPPARVDTPRTDAPDKSYALDLPVGWIRSTTVEKDLVASRDGYGLDAIIVTHRKLDRAFPRTKKAAAPSLLPFELAELEIAEAKAQSPQLAALELIENEPALLSGKDGFRLKVSYRNDLGLEIHHVIYGLADASGYYTLEYRAPRLHYFDKYYGAFETTVASFELVPVK